MCKKTQFKYCPSTIDKCMRKLIEFINDHSNVIETVACCCGHGKYNMTILVRDNLGIVYDLMSGVEIPRTRNFYKKDKEGYYYVPETLKTNKTQEGKQ